MRKYSNNVCYPKVPIIILSHKLWSHPNRLYELYYRNLSSVENWINILLISTIKQAKIDQFSIQWVNAEISTQFHKYPYIMEISINVELRNNELSSWAQYFKYE